MSKKKTWLIVEINNDESWAVLERLVSKKDADAAAKFHTTATGKTVVVYESTFGYKMEGPVQFATVDVA